MRSRFMLALVGIGALCLFGLGINAQEVPQSGAGGNEVSKFKDEAALREQILLRKFIDFQQQVLKLKQRLSRSPRQEDKDRAEVLGKVLDQIRDTSISTKFEKMVDYLKKQDFTKLNDIKLAAEDAKKLADDIKMLVDILREDTRASKLNEERKELEKLIEEINRVILKQKLVQGQTDRGKTDPKELRGNQERVTEATAKIAKAMEGKGQGGEGKNAKGESKAGGKGEGKKGESKDVGKNSGEGKKAESKGSKGAEGKAGKTGEAKGGKSGEGKKSGEGSKSGKGGEGKKGGAKGSKGGEPKSGGAKGSKGGEGKQGGAKGSKGGEGKQGDAKDNGKKADDDKKGGIREKASETKDDDGKNGEKKGDNKQATAKAGDKGGEGKQAGAKGSKAGEKSGSPKSGGSKSSQGEAKSGKSSSGQGQAKSGGQPKSGSPQSGSKGSQPPPPPGQQSQPQVGKKQVQDAEGYQKKAEEDIAKGDNKKASDDQGDAIKKLEDAKKKLEDLLRQIREEELERLLAALQARCERMLAMQKAVLAGTENVYRAIQANADKKPNRDNQGESLRLATKEKEIVEEATKAIQMLEAEGSAVAFPEVFQQVREDMKHVERRLDVVDTGIVTQAIEKDIIATLGEMVDALKKARQDLDNKKNPPPGQPKESGPPQDQKLLEMIAELKMIRSMQLRVNNRTKVYGQMYQGEQAADPDIRRELSNLSQRQERIYEVTHQIARGDNK